MILGSALDAISRFLARTPSLTGLSSTFLCRIPRDWRGAYGKVPALKVRLRHLVGGCTYIAWAAMRGLVKCKMLCMCANCRCNGCIYAWHSYTCEIVGNHGMLRPIRVSYGDRVVCLILKALVRSDSRGIQVYDYEMFNTKRTLAMYLPIVDISCCPQTPREKTRARKYKLVWTC
jgi:hypothetical protein